MLVQRLVHNNRKEIIQATQYYPFERGINRWPVFSPHNGPATRYLFPCDDAFVWLHRQRGTTDSKVRGTNMWPIARFMGPTWGPTGADKTHVSPMLAPWTLISGTPCHLTWRIIKINYEPTFVYFPLERELQRIHEDNLIEINHKNTYVYIFNSVTEIFIGKLGTYIYFDIFSIALYCTVFIHRCRPIRGSIKYTVLASDECLLSIWHLP